MTLLMDVDGVIVRGAIGGGHWSDGLNEHFDFDAACLRKHFFSKHWARVVIGQADAIPCLKQALNEIGSKATAQQVQAFWFQTDASLNRDVLDWIDRQRHTGRRVLLATNQDHDRAAYLMKVLGLEQHCDGIYHSAALGMAKPNRGFFDAIQQTEGKPPAQLTLIDDTAANVAAAMDAGWRAVHFTDAGDLTEAVLG